MDKLKEDLHALSDEEIENGLKYFDEYFGDQNKNDDCENDDQTVDADREQGVGEAETIFVADSSEVRYGDWLYYTDASGIFKKRANDGSAKTKLSDKRGYNITPTGEWIFYIFENLIYKTRADGAVTTPVTTASNTIIKQIIGATNKWVYYLESDGGKDSDISLSVINIHGKYHTSLENNIKSATATNKLLFYGKCDGGMYRIDINKGEKSQKTNKKLCEDKVDNLCIKGGLIKWVHYNNLSDDGKAYKIRMDGTQRQVVDVK